MLMEEEEVPDVCLYNMTLQICVASGISVYLRGFMVRWYKREMRRSRRKREWTGEIIVVVIKVKVE